MSKRTILDPHMTRLALMGVAASKATAEDPLSREAFRATRLAQAVQDTAHAYQATRTAYRAAEGKAPKARARAVLRRAQRAYDAALAAQQAEERAEQVVPAVLRQEHVQRDARWKVRDGVDLDGRERFVTETGDVVLRQPVVERERGSLVRSNPLQRMHERGRHGSRSEPLVTLRHVDAGRRYEAAWYLAGAGLYPVALDPEGTGNGQSRTKGGNVRVEQAAGSSADLDGARHAVGMFGAALLDHVVLEGRDVQDWARRKGVRHEVALGMLVMVLDRLAEHWEGGAGQVVDVLTAVGSVGADA